MPKLLIIHSWGMGDMIMFLPALEQLHKKFKQIDFFITQAASAFPLKNHPAVNNIYVSSYAPKQLLGAVKQLRAKHYDYSLVTSGGTPWKAALFSFAVGAKVKVGERRAWPVPVYGKSCIYNDQLHRGQGNIRLAELLLGPLPKTELRPKLYLPKDSLDFAEQFVNEQVKSRPLMCVHPGSNAKYAVRRWPANEFVVALNIIKAQFPQLAVAIIGGPDELAEATLIAKQTDSLLVTGWKLQQVAALLSKADYFFNTDSGLGHIASCFDTKIFTIFGPADETLTAPLSAKATVIRNQVNVDGLNLKQLRQAQYKALHNLKGQKVAQIITDALQQEQNNA